MPSSDGEARKWLAANHEWLARQGAWPTDLQEYALAHFIILAFFVSLTACLDHLVHNVQRRLEPPEGHTRVRRSDFRREIALKLWMRLQGELMVVGSLVLWIWLSHETGLLEAISSFSLAWQVEHPSVDVNPIHEPLTDLPRYIGWATQCHPRTPRDATTLLHVLQDVLVALFVAKVLYFLFLLLALRTQTEWLATYERLESGGAPRNPAEHFSWRQIDAMREQLVQVLHSEPSLRASVERSADLKQSVDNGTLYVSGFLAETIHAHMQLLAQFSPSTWLLILLYVCATAVSLFLCIPFKHLTLALDIVWYAASLYLCYRLLLHAATLRQTARELEAERHRRHVPTGRPARSGWPAEWVDQLLFPLVGPGVTGFVPCSEKPSELVGMRCLQAMLWVHFYRLGEYATDPFRRHASLKLVAEEALFNLVPKFLVMLLWALWIVPGMLEVFSLPPFLSDLEHSLLLHTLRAYPSGLPADDLLVGREALARAGSPVPANAPSANGVLTVHNGSGGRQQGTPSRPTRDPISFSSGMEYVVLKAQRREESKWPDAWRTLRSNWRWLFGLPPLRNPGRRLADHYAWIHSDAPEDDDGAPSAAPGAADGAGGRQLTFVGPGPGRPSTPVTLALPDGRGGSPSLV